MFEFAQTNLQLYKQLEQLGYDREDRERVASAYRLLVPMFSGQYRASGKPFIAHLVGTASILAVNGQSISHILTGMLHAVYMVGDFGFQPGRRQTAEKRQHIRMSVGEEIETLVAHYDAMSWDLPAVQQYQSDHQSLAEPQRTAIVVQLANSLEDLLDHGVNYCGGAKYDVYACKTMQAELIALCRKFELPRLSDQLEQALEEFNSGITAVATTGSNSRSSLVLPPSSHRKLLPAAQGWLARRWRRITGLAN